ncbi:MAG: hypothetical protein INR70_17815, partial [Parafilimonas terrae]|nr:hypothetical protein [Parafilimonas terrae]
MVVAFFSEGPLAAMAALLTRTGLLVLGDSPAGFTLPERRDGVPAADEVLRAIATCRSRDVVLALPVSLLSDARVLAAVDVAVSVGPDVDDASALPLASTAWRLACDGQSARVTTGARPKVPAYRRPERILPLRLPAVHPTSATFLR